MMNRAAAVARLNDLASFETIFTAFAFVCLYKGHPLVASLNARIDLTILTAIVSFATGMLLVCREPIMPKGKSLLASLIFIVFCLYALSSYVLYGSGSEATLKTAKLLSFIPWIFAAPLLVMNNPTRLRRFVTIVLILASVTSVYALFSGFGGQTMLSVFSPGNYQALGRLCGMASVTFLMYSFHEKTASRKRMYLFSAALFFLMASLSGARQAMVGIIVAWMLYLSGLMLVKTNIKRLIKLAVLLSCLVLVVACVIQLLPSDYLFKAHVEERSLIASLRRITHTLKESKRYDLWYSAVSVWKKHPIIGAGIGSFRCESRLVRWRHAHNMLLELLCELGVCGLLLGLLFAGTTMWALFDLHNSDYRVLGMVLGILWLFNGIAAMFSGDITDNREVYLFAGCILGLENWIRRQKNSQPSSITSRKE